jgi:hypothetical protein
VSGRKIEEELTMNTNRCAEVKCSSNEKKKKRETKTHREKT